jgi:Flp pilus assembly protein TadD
MLFWPGNLSALYLPPIRIDIDFGVVLSFLLLVILGGLGVYLFRRDRLLFFGIALFFLALLPVSQIVPLVTLMNDRYLYFPLLGASWLAGGLTATLFPTTPPKRNYLAVALVGTVLALLTICSFQRTQVWRNSIALWSDVVTKLPDSREPRAALAEAYLNAGRKSEALRAYEEVFAFSGPFTEPLMERKALNNAAVLFMDAGQPDRARTLLTTLTRRYPDYAPGFINLGYNLFLARDLPAAEEAYRRALALQPGYPSAIMGLGNICLETGRLAEARGFYRQALDSGGNGPDLHFNLACLEALSRNPDAALTHLEEALRLGYRNAEALTRNPELATLRQLPAFQRLLALYFPGMRTP